MEQPPQSFDINERSYLIRVFSNLDDKINDSSQLDILQNVPARPQRGKMYYFARAIGAITSEGYWGYTSAGWVKLG